MRTKKFFIAFISTLAIFALTLLATITAAGEEKVLHSFGGGGPQGTNPSGGLIFDAAGNLYGAARYGNPPGYGPCAPMGCGMVFELSPNGRGGWSVTGECYFGNYNYPDGAYPSGSLVFDARGEVYGTTQSGGWIAGSDDGPGTIFHCLPEPGIEVRLYSFSMAGGHFPNGDLIWDATGNLYGTTQLGGSHGGGTAYEYSFETGTEKVLYSFEDGAKPSAGLIFDRAGNLYGTTCNGGIHRLGTVFELMPLGGGHWTEKVLHNFGDRMDGQCPAASLIWDAAGNLYGTTQYGGAYDGGTVFELLPNQDGTWKEKRLRHFGHNLDGKNPSGSLIFDAAGNLYGTTTWGGGHGGGTVFELRPLEDGRWSERQVHDFSGRDGSWPQGGLIWDAAGNLYGTTVYGGSYGAGVVFEITP